MVTNGSAAVAVQAQAEFVFTCIVPFPPAPLMVALCGVRVKVQVTPAWKTVYVACPPLMEMVPIRDCVLMFWDTVYRIVTCVAVPLLLESVIQSLLLVAVRWQLEGEPVTENEPLPPLADGVADALDRETEVQF